VKCNLQEMLEETGARMSEDTLELTLLCWEHLALLDSPGVKFLCGMVCQLIAADVAVFRKQELPCIALALARVGSPFRSSSYMEQVMNDKLEDPPQLLVIGRWGELLCCEMRLCAANLAAFCHHAFHLTH